ncbi:hypothetical protein ACH4F6_31580 [Streptomyces sp. NPDC017936]
MTEQQAADLLAQQRIEAARLAAEAAEAARAEAARLAAEQQR